MTVPAQQIDEPDEDAVAVVIAAAATLAPAQASTTATAAAPLQISIDEDLEVDDGPTILQAFVQLAKTHCKFLSSFINILTYCTEGKKCAQTVLALAEELNIPHLPDLLGRFLF